MLMTYFFLILGELDSNQVLRVEGRGGGHTMSNTRVVRTPICLSDCFFCYLFFRFLFLFLPSSISLFLYLSFYFSFSFSCFSSFLSSFSFFFFSFSLTLSPSLFFSLPPSFSPSPSLLLPPCHLSLSLSHTLFLSISIILSLLSV